MKTNKKAVTYRIEESTIEQVRQEAKDAGQTINMYTNWKLSRKVKTPKNNIQ